MKDKIGNEIFVGCFIAYAIRDGNSGHLKIGKVYALKNNKITVLGVEEDWEGVLVLSSKKGTLPQSDRCMVLHPSQVPIKILNLYKD